MKAAHRKAIRDDGPFMFDPSGALCDKEVRPPGLYGPTERAVVAALNEIAAEPEAVAVARERLLREAVKWVKRNDAPTFLYAVAEVYAKALRAARRAKR